MYVHRMCISSKVSGNSLENSLIGLPEQSIADKFGGKVSGKKLNLLHQHQRLISESGNGGSSFKPQSTMSYVNNSCGKYGITTSSLIP